MGLQSEKPTVTFTDRPSFFICVHSSCSQPGGFFNPSLTVLGEGFYYGCRRRMIQGEKSCQLMEQRARRLVTRLGLYTEKTHMVREVFFFVVVVFLIETEVVCLHLHISVCFRQRKSSLHSFPQRS